MKPSQKLASSLIVPITIPLIAIAIACAKGSTSDTTGVDDLTPAKTAAPTEPEEHATIPPKTTNTGDASPGDASTDANDAAVAACTKTPPSNTCGAATQCGCAADETCDVTDKSNGGVSCVLAGGGTRGLTCDQTGQCERGLTCVRGTCRPFCPPGEEACLGAGVGACWQATDSSGAAVPNLRVCTLSCDLHAPSADCGTNTCIWDPKLKMTDCDVPGTKTMFQDCTVSNDCKPGLACVKRTALKTECESWCRVGRTDDCAIFQTCKDVYGADAPKYGEDRLGNCQ